jgi:hypothetical protein
MDFDNLCQQVVHQMYDKAFSRGVWVKIIDLVRDDSYLRRHPLVMVINSYDNDFAGNEDFVALLGFTVEGKPIITCLCSCWYTAARPPKNWVQVNNEWVPQLEDNKSEEQA